MNIKPLSNSNYYQQNSSGKVSESKEKPGSESKIQDKLELSDEAKKIQNSNSNTKNLDEIKAKISQNFYNSDAVISKVADKILSTMKQ